MPSACVPQAHGLVQGVAGPRLCCQARALVLLLPPRADLLRAVQHDTFQLVVLVALLSGRSGALAQALDLAARATYDLGIVTSARIGLLRRRLAGSGCSEAAQTGA